MEGVDPGTRRKRVGIRNLNGHYETVRAIRAGQNAMREYQDMLGLSSTSRNALTKKIIARLRRYLSTRRRAATAGASAAPAR